MLMARHCLPTRTIVALSLAAMTLSASDAFAQKKSQKIPQDFDILPISITSVVVGQDLAGQPQLIATGLIGSTAFTTPVTLGSRAAAAGKCAILDLQLGPIDLNLLGLRVQTSPICLQVNAYEGGGLLGDLLCSVANLLQGGATLPDVLAALQQSGDTQRFLNGLTSLLDQALDAVIDNNVGSQPQGGLAATCTVLDLSLGPVELNLLGLEVILDNCNGGPVTVTITAIPGGGLLGDLLCSLANLLNNGAPAAAVQQLLWNISRLLAGR